MKAEGWGGGGEYLGEKGYIKPLVAPVSGSVDAEKRGDGGGCSTFLGRMKDEGGRMNGGSGGGLFDVFESRCRLEPRQPCKGA